MTRYLDAVKWKWRGLKMAAICFGRKNNDLWREKQPLKFVKKAEAACRIKNTFLYEDNIPEEFPSLRHPSGVSLQYILMVNHILGGDLYKQFCNPYQEAEVENSEFDILAMLNKAKAAVRK